MTFRPTRRAVALGLAALVAGSLTSTFTLMASRSPEVTAPATTVVEPRLTDPAAPTRDLVPLANYAPVGEDAATLEPAPGPEPVEAVAAPAPRLDPVRLAGGPVPGLPNLDPSLVTAHFRVGTPGFFVGLPTALRDDYEALAEVWREKGAGWGWRMPDYRKVVSSASGTGGSRPPKVDYDLRFTAALNRVGGGRPEGFGADIYSQISPLGLVGVTTWYGDFFHGQVMRYGEIYDMYDPTIAACNVYPGGTRLRVTASNGRYVDVTVKDTGAFQYPIVTDLSWAAFAQLGDPDWGVIDVVVEPLDQIPPDVAAAYGPPQTPFRTRPAASPVAGSVASPSPPAGAGHPSASPVPGVVASPAARVAPPTPTFVPSTATPAPTATPEPTATATRAPTSIPTPTRAPLPTAPPTATIAASATPEPLRAPVPIGTAVPTRTPTPAATPTPRPANTPARPPATATAEMDRPAALPTPRPPTAPVAPIASPAAPAPANPPNTAPRDGS